VALVAFASRSECLSARPCLRVRFVLRARRSERPSDPSVRFVDPPAFLCREQRPAPSLPHSAEQRLQAFSASWRVTPLATYPPCFMRDPLLGFGTFRGFPSASARVASRRRVPLMSLPCAQARSGAHHRRGRGRERRGPNRQHPVTPQRKRCEAMLPVNAGQHASEDSTAETAKPLQTCCPCRPQLATEVVSHQSTRMRRPEMACAEALAVVRRHGGAHRP